MDLLWQRALALLAAVLICAAIHSYAYIVQGHEFLHKYPPDWSAFGVVRAISLIIASLLLLTAIRPPPEQTRPDGWIELPFGWLTVGVLMLAASAFVLIIWPDLITESKEEGQALGVLTEIVLLASLPLLTMAIWHARQSESPSFLVLGPVWLLSAVMAVTILILMEEMSWGQHWLGFETPELFADNVQNETNLHNFYTWPFEAAYYSAAVLFFVLLPYAWPRRVPKIIKGLAVFVPPRSFAILALPVCGLFYETWNYAMNQVWFYLGVFIAIDIYRSNSDPHVKRRIVVIGSTLIASQIVFLLFGDTLQQGFEMTELREVAIPLAILAYSSILYRRFRGQPEHRAKLAHQD